MCQCDTLRMSCWVCVCVCVCVCRGENILSQGRLVPGSKEGLEETLQWLGVQFHESPSKGGPYGPYIQVCFLCTLKRAQRDPQT